MARHRVPAVSVTHRDILNISTLIVIGLTPTAVTLGSSVSVREPSQKSLIEVSPLWSIVSTTFPPLSRSTKRSARFETSNFCSEIGRILVSTNASPRGGSPGEDLPQVLCQAGSQLLRAASADYCRDRTDRHSLTSDALLGAQLISCCF